MKFQTRRVSVPSQWFRGVGKPVSSSKQSINAQKPTGILMKPFGRGFLHKPLRDVWDPGCWEWHRMRGTRLTNLRGKESKTRRTVRQEKLIWFRVVARASN